MDFFSLWIDENLILLRTGRILRAEITGRISLLLDFGGEFAIMKASLYPKGGLGLFMSSVIVKENESLDSALRRFKRNCAKAGIQQEIRKREHYEKPSVRRKKKSEAARKRKFN